MLRSRFVSRTPLIPGKTALSGCVTRLDVRFQRMERKGRAEQQSLGGRRSPSKQVSWRVCVCVRPPFRVEPAEMLKLWVTGISKYSRVMFLYEEFIQHVRRGRVQLNKTAILIRSGTVKSIFRTQEAMLVTKNKPLQAEDLTISVWFYSMLHERIACLAVHLLSAGTGVFPPLPSVLSGRWEMGKKKQKQTAADWRMRWQDCFNLMCYSQEAVGVM